MGRIVAPVRTAQRGRQPMVRASRFAGVRMHPLYKECTSPRACALDTRRQPDAGAIAASRPATSDDQGPPLVEWDRMNRNICPQKISSFKTGLKVDFAVA